MDLNIKSITIGRYKILFQKCLTPDETKQWWAHKREEDATAHIRAIEANKRSIEEHRQHIREIEAGRWDYLISVYQQMGREETRETRIASAKESIATCESWLAWFAEQAASHNSVAATPAEV